MLLLEPEELIHAYCQGIFPMGDAHGGIAWFRPRYRGILPLDDAFHIPRRFMRFLRQSDAEIFMDNDFSAVIRACAERDETWITPPIIAAYEALFQLGYAHCCEVWQQGKLIGGIYGVSIGAAFFGESMFSRQPQASKIALVCMQLRLRQQGFLLHDTQWTTAHLAQFGGYEIPAYEYDKKLQKTVRRHTEWGAIGFLGSVKQFIANPKNHVQNLREVINKQNHED